MDNGWQQIRIKNETTGTRVGTVYLSQPVFPALKVWHVDVMNLQQFGFTTAAVCDHAALLVTGQNVATHMVWHSSGYSSPLAPSPVPLPPSLSCSLWLSLAPFPVNGVSHLTYFNVWRGGPPGRQTNWPAWQSDRQLGGPVHHCIYSPQK